MRKICKPNAKLGHSKAYSYRSGVFSPASDIEALVDAYGLTELIKIAGMIEADMRKWGDSVHNGYYNMHLNSLPLPVLRKQNKPENKAKRKKKA